MSATHGSKSQLLQTQKPSLTITDLALTDTGDHTTFKIGSSDQAKRYWDRTATFVFQTSTDGSTWNTATPASVRYVGGKVTFSGVVGGTHQARIHSGKYLPYSAVANITKYGFDLDRDVCEDTSLTTTGTPTRERTFQGGLNNATFKFTKWNVDDLYASDTITDDDALIASIVVDVTQVTPTRLECFGYLTKDSIETPIDDLIGEDLDFQSDGGFFINP
jgi:hypothetical protein